MLYSRSKISIHVEKYKFWSNNLTGEIAYVFKYISEMIVILHKKTQVSRIFADLLFRWSSFIRPPMHEHGMRIACIRIASGSYLSGVDLS